MEYLLWDELEWELGEGDAGLMWTDVVFIPPGEVGVSVTGGLWPVASISDVICARPQHLGLESISGPD